MITMLLGGIWETAFVASVAAFLGTIVGRRPSRTPYQDLEDPATTAGALGVQASGASGETRDLAVRKCAAIRLTIFIDKPNRFDYIECMKVRDVLKRLAEDGWTVVRIKGSHQQLQHATKPGTVTVPGHDGDDVKPGTLNSILKQAGLK